MTNAKVTALIPARGGSKGLPGKNIRPLAGRPLIAWSIDAAAASPWVGRVVVSTDADDIAAIARNHGATVSMRPAELASDTATSADVIRHHIAEWRREGQVPHAIILLQPTSPLRTAADISGAIEAFLDGDFDSLASFAETKAHPQTTWRIVEGVPRPFYPDQRWVRRQDLEPAFSLNGAIYVVKAERFPSEGSSFLFGETGAYLMPPERSLDIDTLQDFACCETILNLPRPS